MATSGDRCEVAERLRDLPRTADADGCCTAWDVLFALGMKRCDAIGFVNAVDAQRLADLIDRPTCHDVGGGYEFRCSGCGCAIHIYRDGGFGEDDSAMTVGGGSLYVPHYCPNCGARVVRDDD